jgi:di/tricarboxylate transporter
LYLIYIATLVMTEVISNNAAAALMYPISVKLADAMGVSYKPFAMVVMNAASMAFMCPIGYPTHIMVWGPGKYSFFDFFKFGLVPNFLWLVITCLIAPAVWPL